VSFEKKAAKFFKLTDENWMKHTNPWSVWTRFLIFPLIALAIWSRVWFGWYSLVFIGIMILWTWLNPRAFGKPKTTKYWSSKAVLGERVWINRKEIPIPHHHITAIIILNCITVSGLPFFIWGLYTLHIWSTLLGIVLVYVGKMWFLDRMVWLYEDMKEKNPEYKNWEY
jgi:hypothetical protein